LSLLPQHDCRPDANCHALTCNRDGRAAGPFSVLLDLLAEAD
jgi:hypothetical protein